jgi:hypothetical protein
MAYARKTTAMKTPSAYGRVRKPSYRLTFEDAVTVWKWYWSGEFQNRIAARFDCNPARGFQLLAGSKAGSFTAKAFSSGKLSQAVNSARSPAAIRSLEARILIAMAA